MRGKHVEQHIGAKDMPFTVYVYSIPSAWPPRRAGDQLRLLRICTLTKRCPRAICNFRLGIPYSEWAHKAPDIVNTGDRCHAPTPSTSHGLSMLQPCGTHAERAKHCHTSPSFLHPMLIMAAMILASPIHKKDRETTAPPSANHSRTP